MAAYCLSFLSLINDYHAGLPLPGRLHAGGDRAEARLERVADFGLVPEPSRQVPQEGKHQEGAGAAGPQRAPADLQRGADDTRSKSYDF